MPLARTSLTERAAAVRFFGHDAVVAAAIVLASVTVAAHALAAPPVGLEATSSHWAFQPVGKPPVPERSVGRYREKDGRVVSAIDAFILARLPTGTFAPPADKRTLLRRATFDLTGLPPAPAEIDAFLADKSPEAFRRVVDRLLASPRYGERWGRHWMDVARYADTAGDNADYPIPEARLYRDYIIDALNADKPYDEFVREQLAGDLLAADGPPERHAERVVATGFLALSRRYATAPFEFMHLTIEDAIETTGRAFLGMTFRCARCHDHKYDPVTREDYYALYGLFESTRFPYAGSEEFQSKKFPRSGFQPLAPAAEAAPLLAAYTNRLGTLETGVRECEKELQTAKQAGTNAPPAARQALEEKLKRLNADLAGFKKPGAPPGLPVAYAVADGHPVNSRLQPRGEPDETGAAVPRRAPRFLAPAGEDSLNIPTGSSGRREFARWLTKPENPLLARVMVNRLWQHHFGRGLVATPSNFGLRGDPPTHPELLDYLARAFVENGWSVKAMHRVIMNSAVYQQASSSRPAAPDAYSSFPRRRLSAEEIRDTLLLVSGRLDLNRPGAHPFPPIADWQWTQHNPFKAVYESNHRSVYLMTQRLQRHPYLALFDAPDANVSTDVRTSSTVPLQALYTMNNRFMDAQASALARRLIAATPEEKARLHLAAVLTWGREMTPTETRRGRRYLAEVREALGGSGSPQPKIEEEAWSSYARVLLAANEFVFVD